MTLLTSTTNLIASNDFHKKNQEINQTNKKALSGIKKFPLPHIIVERFHAFEMKKLDKKLKDHSLRELTLKELASNELKNIMVFRFPEKSNLRPLRGIRRLLHHHIASTVSLASQHTQEQRFGQDLMRFSSAQDLMEQKFTVIRLTLEDEDGIRYDSILSGKIEHIIAGKFVFRLGGNNETYERSFLEETLLNDSGDFATFQSNGPGVGRSQGRPSYASMIECARLGLRFLESLSEHYREHRKGEKGKIVLKGFSLGNGVLSEVLRWYNLNTSDNDYLVYSINTFSRLSDVPSGFVGQCVENYLLRRAAEKICFVVDRLFRWAKFDFDAVWAARRLSRLGICQTIMQASIPDGEKLIAVDDGVISADASLLSHVIRIKNMQKKIFVPNEFYDLEKLQECKRTKFTHCQEDRDCSLLMLTNFDDIKNSI
jgi:hypothetical protein